MTERKVNCLKFLATKWQRTTQVMDPGSRFWLLIFSSFYSTLTYKKMPCLGKFASWRKQLLWLAPKRMTAKNSSITGVLCFQGPQSRMAHTWVASRANFHMQQIWKDLAGGYINMLSALGKSLRLVFKLLPSSVWIFTSLVPVIVMRWCPHSARLSRRRETKSSKKQMPFPELKRNRIFWKNFWEILPSISFFIGQN